jgi:hypothetical protein
MTEGAPCIGHRGYEDVLDADTAGAVRPCSPDGHRTGGRRLLGTLPEVRHRGTGAGNVGRSAAGAVGAGAAEQEKVTLSCSRSADGASCRLAASG